MLKKKILITMSKAGAGDLIPVSKKMKRDPPGEGLGLGDLPELALLEIAKHLELQDLLHLSIASSRVWRLVGTKSVLWSKLLQCMNITVSPRLEVLASRFSTLFPSSCEEKRRLMVYKKTRNNWKSGNISQVWTHYAYVFATQNDILLFGRDDDGDNGPDYTTWNFTISGPKVASNWTYYQIPGSMLESSSVEFFIFKDKICLKFFEETKDTM